MNYPNIEAIAQGTISGEFCEWPLVKPEAIGLLADLATTEAERLRHANHSIELTEELAESRALFARHTDAVASFLNELYSITVDPLADGKMEVSEMKTALLVAAERNRAELGRPPVNHVSLIGDQTAPDARLALARLLQRFYSVRDLIKNYPDRLLKFPDARDREAIAFAEKVFTPPSAPAPAAALAPFPPR